MLHTDYLILAVVAIILIGGGINLLHQANSYKRLRQLEFRHQKNREVFMDDFLQGFFKGAKETPKGFFAPAVAIWRLLIETSESLTESYYKNN